MIIPGSLWRPIGGCYGKIHHVDSETGVSLCGIGGNSWFFGLEKKPDITCKTCAKLYKKTRTSYAPIMFLTV